ncbi:MAG: RDD family protein [Thermoplasmatota archaeon]
MEHASLASRIVAYLIDAVILVVILFSLFMLSFSMMSTDRAVQIVREQTELGLDLPLFLLSSIVIVGYFTIFESSNVWGATPGKRFVGIEVVYEYGDVTFFRSFLRNVTRILWSLPCIGLIIVLINVVLIADSKMRMGDILAGTNVVKKKSDLVYTSSNLGQDPWV